MPEALVDANVLLRHLTDQPRDLADQAQAIFEAAERLRIDLVVAPLILAEVVYVLESVYNWPRAEVATRLLDLNAADVLGILERDAILHALAWYRDVRGLAFADAYVAALAAARGDATVVSFDRPLRRIPAIRLVDDATRLRG